MGASPQMMLSLLFHHAVKCNIIWDKRRHFMPWFEFTAECTPPSKCLAVFPLDFGLVGNWKCLHQLPFCIQSCFNVGHGAKLYNHHKIIPLDPLSACYWIRMQKRPKFSESSYSPPLWSQFAPLCPLDPFQSLTIKHPCIVVHTVLQLQLSSSKTLPRNKKRERPTTCKVLQNNLSTELHWDFVST